MHLLVTIYFFFLQTGIDPLAVKLENDDEDDLMQLKTDAFMTDGEEEELEEDLKDVMKDLNMLPDKCEVPQPDLLPAVTDDEVRDIKKMTVAAQMLKLAGELQTWAMVIINELVEKKTYSRWPSGYNSPCCSNSTKSKYSPNTCKWCKWQPITNY